MVKAASLLALLAVLALPAVASAQPGSEPVYDFFGAFHHNRLEIGLDHTHAPGEPARPVEPLRSFEFSAPDESRFFGPRIGFCFTPDACPDRSRIGSGEIAFNFGPSGTQVFDARIFNARGGFFLVPFRADPAPPVPFRLPPPLFFDKSGDSFAGLFPEPFCPEPGATSCDPNSLAFAMGLDLGFNRRYAKLPKECPPPGQFHFGAAVIPSPGEILPSTRDQCEEPRNLQCMTTTTVAGPPRDNMGNVLGAQSVFATSVCNRKINQVRLTGAGRRLRACEDGQGARCRITTTVTEDDTAIFNGRFGRGTQITTTIDTDPDVEPGTELRLQFIGPAGVVEDSAVM